MSDTAEYTFSANVENALWNLLYESNNCFSAINEYIYRLRFALAAVYGAEKATELANMALVDTVVHVCGIHDFATLEDYCREVDIVDELGRDSDDMKTLLQLLEIPESAPEEKTDE